MKRFFSLSVAVAMLFGAALSFVSCSSGDDDSGSTTGSSTSTGTNASTGTSTTPSSSKYASYEIVYEQHGIILVTFKTDGTWNLSAVGKTRASGTYTGDPTKDGDVKVTADGRSATWKVKDGTLTDDEGEKYTKKAN